MNYRNIGMGLLNKIMKKIYLNPQSKGNLGKSFETECRSAWLDALGIEWIGYDLDDRHRTFSKRHSQKVKLVNLDHGAKDALLSVFSEAFKRPEPVVMMDTRAQSDHLMLEAILELKVFERAQQIGARFVYTLFPSDDNESLQNLAQIIKISAGKVDYVIARNPAKAKGRIYDQAPLKVTLMEKLKAKEIQIPTMTSTTQQILEKEERIRQRGISFSEFAEGTLELDPLVTGEMAYLLGRMATQYNNMAELLIPESQIDKIPKFQHSKSKELIEDLDLSL